MKSKGISVLILSIALILTVTLILASFGLSKPKPKSELITFSGDLVGSQEVVGCCPNAGPNPEYNMSLLSDEFPEEFRGEHTGYIFMNNYAPKNVPKLQWGYKVVFWWRTKDGNEYLIDIRGGDIESNKKTKILKVTFDEVPCEIYINKGHTETVTINFILKRDPHHPGR